MVRKDYLVVVDMQNDFVDGVLGSKEAQAIVPKVVEKVKNWDGNVIFTKDTHSADYLKTQEGKKLPVPHCIVETEGWEIISELKPYVDKCLVYEKPSFGSVDLAKDMYDFDEWFHLNSITLIGLCTDICVISNAMILKAHLPEVNIIVDASCCAGVTPESHKNALEAMKACQIEVINDDESVYTSGPSISTNQYSEKSYRVKVGELYE